MPGMKAGGRILLVVLGLLLGLAVIVAQAAFKIDRTVLSYTCMSRQLERIAAPLRDPGIRTDAANGVFDYLRTVLSLKLSPALDPYIPAAVTAGFDADWFLRTGKRLLFNTQAYVTGRETGLSLPVSIDGFKLALIDSARGKIETRAYLEIDREVSRMTSSIDLVTLLAESDLSRIESRLKNYRGGLTAVKYVVPAVLFLLCFVTRRIGSGLAAAGGGVLTGGGLMLFTSLVIPGLAFREVSGAVTHALPSFLGWVGEGVGRTTGDIISGLLPAAAVLTGLGMILTAAGVILIKVKANPMINMPGAH